MSAAQDDVLYFAFGANMAAEILERRRMTPTSREAARCEGHELVFDLRGFNRLEPAFASIRARDGGCVHGVLYRLRPEDFARVTRWESDKYRTIDVAVEGARSGRVVARAFQTRQPTEGLRPSRRYLRLLRRGAEEAQLPAEYQRWLAAQPYAYTPVLSDVLEAAWGALSQAYRVGIARKQLGRRLERAVRRWTGED